MTLRNPGIEPLCISVEEAAELLCLSRQTVYTLMDTEGLPSVHFGKARKVPMAELKTWLTARVAEERQRREDQARSLEPMKIIKSTPLAAARNGNGTRRK